MSSDCRYKLGQVTVTEPAKRMRLGKFGNLCGHLRGVAAELKAVNRTIADTMLLLKLAREALEGGTGLTKS